VTNPKEYEFFLGYCANSGFQVWTCQKNQDFWTILIFMDDMLCHGSQKLEKKIEGSTWHVLIMKGISPYSTDSSLLRTH